MTGGSAIRVQAPLVMVDLQLGAVTTFMHSQKGYHKPHVSASSVLAAWCLVLRILGYVVAAAKIKFVNDKCLPCHPNDSIFLRAQL